MKTNDRFALILMFFTVWLAVIFSIPEVPERNAALLSTIPLLLGIYLFYKADTDD